MEEAGGYHSFPLWWSVWVDGLHMPGSPLAAVYNLEPLCCVPKILPLKRTACQPEP